MTLGRQIGIALLFTAVSSAVVYLVTTLIPKTYESEQVLIFPGAQPAVASIASAVLGNNQGSGSDMSSFAASGGISSPVFGTSTDTAKGILESRNCREYVAKKLDLGSKWSLSPTKTLDELRRKTKVRIDDNGFLVISCQAGSPELARDIVKTMYDYLGTGSVKLTLSVGGRNKKVIEDRLAVGEAKMMKARQNLVDVATRHPYVESSPIQDLLADALKKQGETRVAISGAETRIRSVESTVKKALASGITISALEASSGGQLDKGLETLVQDLQKRRLDLEDAKRTYTEKSPEFKIAAERTKAGQNAAKRAMDESARSIEDKTFAPLIVARSELASLRRVAQGYDQILAEYKKMALKTPEDASFVKIAQSQFETALKTSESLRFQLEQATIAEERDPARYEVVDEAIADPDPVSPRKGLITGAWAGCVLAGAAWMIVRQRIKFVD